MKKVYDELNQKDLTKNIECLVIYPDLEIKENDLSNLKTSENAIKKYVGFYKVGVSVPIVKKI